MLSNWKRARIFSTSGYCLVSKFYVDFKEVKWHIGFGVFPKVLDRNQKINDKFPRLFIPNLYFGEAKTLWKITCRDEPSKVMQGMRIDFLCKYEQNYLGMGPS